MLSLHPKIRDAAVALVLLVAPAVQARAQNGLQANNMSPHRKAQAEQLLRTRLACLGCHAINGTGGRVGPDLSDVGRRRTREYIRAMIVDPQRLVPGSIMPRIALPAKTLDLVVEYLAAARNPIRAQPLVTRPRIPADAGADQKLYLQHCAICHGDRGRGDGANAKYVGAYVIRHDDKRAMGARTDDRLYDGIYAGGYIMGGSGRMPPFGQTLNSAEIQALVRYIRQLCECEGPQWSRDGVRPASTL